MSLREIAVASVPVLSEAHGRIKPCSVNAASWFRSVRFLSGLDDVPAIRDASPQARHCFTLADQVNQLVSASEADPERGFMARLMALLSSHEPVVSPWR